jgi:lipoate-protein ligase A
MARDRALLEEVTRDGGLRFRVYRWSEPWVSLGLFQNPERDLLPQNPIPWVMRPTGGKAVLHGHDVTVGLALSLDRLGDPRQLERQIKVVYRAVVQPLVAALTTSGLPAKLAEETRFAGKGPRTADCFAHVSPNDIVDPSTGRKVCGCALKVTDRAVLVQASIPNGNPLLDPQRVFRVASSVSGPVWDPTPLFDALTHETSHLN